MTGLRDLGTSGLSIPPLVLGGNVFGWTIDKAASFRILDRFAGHIVDSGGRRGQPLRKRGSVEFALCQPFGHPTDRRGSGGVDA